VRRPAGAARALLLATVALAAGGAVACRPWDTRNGADEGRELPIEVTVEHPVDSPGAAALAEPCALPPGP
jgi:hypothetical protein